MSAAVGIRVSEQDQFRPSQAPFVQDTSNVNFSAGSERDRAPKLHFFMILPTSDSIGKLHLRLYNIASCQVNTSCAQVSCSSSVSHTHAVREPAACGGKNRTKALYLVIFGLEMVSAHVGIQIESVKSLYSARLSPGKSVKN